MTDNEHREGESNEQPQGSPEGRGGHHQEEHGEAAEDRVRPEPSAPEEGNHLLREYRFQVLEVLKSETDPTVKASLISHLEQEGVRELETERLARMAGKDALDAELEAQSRIAKDGRQGLYISSAINVLKWAGPAAFSILLGFWMRSFYIAGKEDAARSVRELLLLVLGGALGWVARGSNGGNGE